MRLSILLAGFVFWYRMPAGFPRCSGVSGPKSGPTLWIVEGRVEVCATPIRPWLTAHNIPHVDRTTADGAESGRSTEIE